MQRRYELTSRNLSCPVCSDSSGKCRQDKEFENRWLCMNSHSGTVPGYRWLRESKNPLWSIWVSDSDAREDTRQKPEPAPVLPSMLAIDRDRHYRKILSHLSLHDDDLHDLHRRGLSDAEIELGGFKSVERYQSLPQQFPVALPGVKDDGRSFTNMGAGYLTPVYNLRGLLVGLQLRLRQVPEDGQRYKWLSANGSVKMSNGEYPLCVRVPVEPVPGIVGMAEGLGVKPFIAAIRLNQVTLGASGGQFHGSPEILGATLKHYNATEVRFYPDGGSICNPNVLRTYYTTWELLKDLGYKPQVGWWGQSSKQGGDVDEIDVTRIQYESVSRFWMRCKSLAIACYQDECRLLGTKTDIPDEHPVGLWRMVERMRNDRMGCRYQFWVRQLMAQQGLNWSDHRITTWLSDHNATPSAISINHLKSLCSYLETLTK